MDRDNIVDLVIKRLDDIENKLLSKNTIRQLIDIDSTEYDKGIVYGKMEMIEELRREVSKWITKQ